MLYISLYSNSISPGFSIALSCWIYLLGSFQLTNGRKLTSDSGLAITLWSSPLNFLAFSSIKRPSVPSFSLNCYIALFISQTSRTPQHTF